MARIYDEFKDTTIQDTSQIHDWTMTHRLLLQRSKTTLSKTDAILERQTSILQRKKSNLSSRKKGLFEDTESGYNYVAAIEIGTSYSGYAYCESRDGKAVTHQHIVMNPVWITTDRQTTSLRTPTCILLNEKKEFEAYGYEAQKLYFDLMKENKHTKWYYFRRYKTKIFGIKDLRCNSLITEENGKQCTALTVFSMSIRYMKSQLMNDICLHGKDVDADEIKWVITIPAIWDDLAKQFIRRAAEKAGLPPDMIKLCYEPEAASIFCQNLPSNMIGDRLPIMKSGVKYALANLGGGITEIVFHEKRKDGLREIGRGGGTKLGAGEVDNIFVQFLGKLFGQNILNDFIEYHRKDFLVLMKEFEMQKRTITPKATSYMEIRVPASLEIICRKHQFNDTLANVVFRSVYQGRVKYLAQRLRIDAVVSNEFFRATTLEMAKLIDKTLKAIKTTEDISILVLTGAFAASEVVQEIMHKELVGKSQIKKIIVPPESDMAALKGAIMFGNNPSSIACRVNKETVGLRIARLFNPEMYAPDRRAVLHGTEYVLDIFSPFLSVGTRVPVGFMAHQVLTSTEPNQQKIEVDIFTSPKLSNNFVHDEGVKQLGKLEFKIPMPSEEARTVYVDVVLGETELVIYLTDKKTLMKSKHTFPPLRER